MSPVMAITLDPKTHELVPVSIPPDEAAKLAAAAAELATRMLTIDQVQCEALPGFPGLVDVKRHLAWLSSIQVALNRKLPLWSDDAAHRALARERGASAFGTVDLISVLVREGRVVPEEARAWNQAMVEARIGDLPLDPDLVIGVAEAAAWLPGPASVVLARPATWLDHVTAHETVSRIFEKVSEQAPSQLAHWVYAAVTGVSSRMPDSAHLLGGILLAMAIADRGLNPPDVPNLVMAAREACKNIGAGDPLPPAVDQLLETASQSMGPRDAASLTLSAFSEMPEDDRTAVGKIVFPSRS